HRCQERQQERGSDAREERRSVALRRGARGEGLTASRVTRWRVSPASVAPADGSFRGAGPEPAPSSYLPVEYAPLRRKGLRAVKSPQASPPAFFGSPHGVRPSCMRMPAAPCWRKKT